MSFTHRLEKDLEGYIGSVLIIGFTFVILYNILSRSFLGSQLGGSLNLTLGAFTWMSWIAAAFAIRHDSHLRFTLFRRGFTRRQNYALYVVEWALWGVVTVAILYFSLPVLQTRIASDTQIVGTHIPSYLLYVSIPVGMVFILMRTVQQAKRVTAAYRRGEDIGPTAKIGQETDQ